MTAILHGIKSCDTCRRARRWLDETGTAYRFSDLREDGVAARTLKRWVDHVGWETLLNRRSTTWRSLGEDQRAGLDEDGALALMEAHPTLIKRPVLEVDGAVCVGFSQARYTELLRA